MAPTMGEGVLRSKLTPPIFVIDGLDVGVFKSIEDAVLQLEPVDVNRGDYAAYDAEGRLLRLAVDGLKVTAHPVESEASHAKELSVALSEFLRAMGVMTDDDSEYDLRELVEASRKFMYSPPKLWPFRKRSEET